MMTLLNIGAVLLGLAALLLLAQLGAWQMTDANIHSCHGARPVLNFKPFNCRACLTFWFTIVLLFPALGFTQHFNLHNALVALIFAFINYFYIKTKINIYE